MGGQSSYRYMRDPAYLERLNPTVQQLIKNAISWDDAHIPTAEEIVKKNQISEAIIQQLSHSKSSRL